MSPFQTPNRRYFCWSTGLMFTLHLCHSTKDGWHNCIWQCLFKSLSGTNFWVAFKHCLNKLSFYSLKFSTVFYSLKILKLLNLLCSDNSFFPFQFLAVTVRSAFCLIQKSQKCFHTWQTEPWITWLHQPLFTSVVGQTRKSKSQVWKH